MHIGHAEGRRSLRKQLADPQNVQTIGIGSREQFLNALQGDIGPHRWPTSASTPTKGNQAWNLAAGNGKHCPDTPAYRDGVWLGNPRHAGTGMIGFAIFRSCSVFTPAGTASMGGDQHAPEPSTNCGAMDQPAAQHRLRPRSDELYLLGVGLTNASPPGCSATA